MLSICLGSLYRGLATTSLQHTATKALTGTHNSLVCSSTSWYSSGAGNTDTSTIGNEKVRKLADDVLSLTVLECSWLSEILRKKLNMPAAPAVGAMPMLPMMGAMPAAAPAAAAPAAEPEQPAKKAPEKTLFDVKLESFSADGKIKVIKEIRAVTSLGLKEAKELVEKAPVVVKSEISKEEAENLKKLLEAAGGKVVLV